MKILRLKALNINSLKGATEINFTQLLKDDTLFAITGPTGAGKSTLLDVISCALYGRTARLKNPNDLMSRHSGEAMCEVEFEVKGVVYRSSWTQKRARNRHDGNFQQAKMELSNVNSTKVIKTGARDVPKFIEELSGLDFDRFTQSMMLAQGSFDAFLKAKESDRSALLEKITGTKIYADISKRVYEKHINYKQEIEIEEKSLDTIELIDEKVLEEKEKRLTLNKTQKLELDIELKELNLALSWMQTLLKLTIESEKYEQKFIEISQQKEDKKEDFIKLSLANKALSITPLFTKKTELAKGLEDDTKFFENLSMEIEILEGNITECKISYDLIQKEYAQAQVDLEAQTKKLQNARVIQTQEQENRKSLVEITKSITAKRDDEQLLIKNLDKITQEFTNLQLEMKRQNSYLQTNSKDEKLISSLSLIGQNIEQFAQTDNQLKALVIEKQKLQDAFSKTKQRLQEIQDEVDILALKSKNDIENYTDIEQKSAIDSKEELKLQTEISQLNRLLSELLSYKELTKAESKELEKIKENSKKEESLTSTIKSLIQHLEDIKSHIKTLQIKKEQELLIKKYEEDRDKLLFGEECFVCGSTEHPFVKDMKKVSIDDTSSQIKEKEFKLEQKESELKILESKATTVRIKIENSNLEIKKYRKQILSICEAFDITKQCEEDLKQKLKNSNEALVFISKRREEKEFLLKKRDASTNQLRAKENTLNIIKTEFISIKEMQKQFNKKEKESVENIERLKKLLSDGCIEYDLVFDSTSYYDQYKELLKRKDFYVKTLENYKQLDKKLQSCNLEKNHNETKSESLKVEILNLNKNLLKIEEVIKILSQKRVSILNVENLEFYEKEINDIFKVIQTKEKKASNKLQELSTKHLEKTKQSKFLEEKIAKANEKLMILSKEFTSELKKQEFETIGHFRDAILPNQNREELAISLKSIEDKFNETKTLKVDAFKRLTEHKQEPLTDKSIEILKEELSVCQQKVDVLQLSIGHNEKELELNSVNKNKYKEKIEFLQTKKEALKVWEKMQELIGSADGTKFAKFAQGITLDQLIILANQHLKILSERYILMRSREQKQLLEIEIIDRFQGNVIRSVSTLSGGEGFIVSLALALGLSKLASEKIAIDSLFLDEGFGTLDEDSLETALNALSLLQNSGKMIGVISHVEALKERIPLQIKVIPHGDGTSCVEI